MKIIVLSKEEFKSILEMNSVNNDTVHTFKNIFFISINNTDSNNAYLEEKENVKVLYFDDCYYDEFANKVMTDEQADELLNFIDSQIANNKDTCIVHCEAGISRSGAVGTFICDYTESDWNEFIHTNPQIHPNIVILNKLKKAVFRKHNAIMY
jgi:protein-tyrosine phosphatase